MVKKIFKIIVNTILMIVFLFGALAIISFLPITGNIKLLTVMSGSMEPKIKIGSLVVVKPESEYGIGDIVTRNTGDKNITITHRIVEMRTDNGKTIFRTKGDINSIADNEETTPDKIVGKVIFNIPHIGYPIGYAKTTPGLILIVVIPAVIIVYEELRKISSELALMRKRKKTNQMDLTEKKIEKAEIKLDHPALTFPEKRFAPGAERSPVKRKIV